LIGNNENTLAKKVYGSPYSLGKLIDWKHENVKNRQVAIPNDSLLAREIN